MWTDEEGDNVCFSSDEELTQAVKFIKGQESQLFKVIFIFSPGQKVLDKEFSFNKFQGDHSFPSQPLRKTRSQKA